MHSQLTHNFYYGWGLYYMCSLKLHNLNDETMYVREVEGLVTVLGIPDFLFLVIKKKVFRTGWHLAMLNKKRCFKRLICPLHYGILPTKGHVQSSNYSDDQHRNTNPHESHGPFSLLLLLQTLCKKKWLYYIYALPGKVFIPLKTFK